jgi:hypothetical protein
MKSGPRRWIRGPGFSENQTALSAVNGRRVPSPWPCPCRRCSPPSRGRPGSPPSRSTRLVRVRVVVQHVDGHRRILGRGGDIVGDDGRIVDRRDAQCGIDVGCSRAPQQMDIRGRLSSRRILVVMGAVDTVRSLDANSINAALQAVYRVVPGCIGGGTLDQNPLTVVVAVDNDQNSLRPRIACHRDCASNTG